MKHRETAADGSFLAWGIGFYYEYDAGINALDIIHARRNKPLIYIDLDRDLSETALRFVEVFEKATQINALMFSNNATIDLSETIDDKKLAAILAGSANLARHCMDLELGRYKRFQKLFCEDSHLKRIEISQTKDFAGRPTFYSVRCQTNRLNSVHASHTELYGALHELSAKIINDIVTVEFSHNSDSSAHEILRASSMISTLSLILNPKFQPVKKIKRKKPALPDKKVKKIIK